MNLENELIIYQKTIANFPEKEKRQKDIIAELQGRLGSNIGHTPSVEEIRKEQDKLLALGRELAIAEEELPNIEVQLDELRKKLEKIEAGKKFSKQKRYATPSEELTDRAKKYAREYAIDYETAAREILEEDLVLSTAYNLYDIDTLIGLKD